MVSVEVWVGACLLVFEHAEESVEVLIYLNTNPLKLNITITFIALISNSTCRQGSISLKMI
jgi:hypothetical protein